MGTYFKSISMIDITALVEAGVLEVVRQLDQACREAGFFYVVRSRSGEWIWVPPIPGTFVCNRGDMLEILTNGLYESSLHQVFNSAPKYRVCLAYYQTTYYTVIEPLDICVQKSGGIKKLGGAIYGENLCEHQRNSYK